MINPIIIKNCDFPHENIHPYNLYKCDNTVHTTVLIEYRWKLLS